MRQLISIVAAGLMVAASAQAAPVTAIAINPGTTAITVLEDDSNLLSNQRWLTFTAVAGTQIRLFVNSVGNSKDPCQELYFGDVNGLDFGSRSGNCLAANASPELDFVASNDDLFNSLSSLIDITASQTGTYSLVVTDLADANTFNLEATFTPQRNDVPVPGTLALAGLGLALLGLARRRA